MKDSPAFPVFGGDNSHLVEDYGMTLRDYFAAQALQGQLAHTGWNVPKDAAKWAYDMADAMMKQREEK